MLRFVVVFFVLVLGVVLVFAGCAVVCVVTDAALVVYTFLAGAVSESLFAVFSSIFVHYFCLD